MKSKTLLKVQLSNQPGSRNLLLEITKGNQQAKDMLVHLVGDAALEYVKEKSKNKKWVESLKS